MEKLVELNEIKRKVYNEKEEKMFEIISSLLKEHNLEKYITNYTINLCLSIEEAFVIFKDAFIMEFNTENYTISKIETTYSNQTIDKEFVEIATILYSLKKQQDATLELVKKIK